VFSPSVQDTFSDSAFDVTHEHDEVRHREYAEHSQMSEILQNILLYIVSQSFGVGFGLFVHIVLQRCGTALAQGMFLEGDQVAGFFERKPLVKQYVDE
jgi:hypothetical protein